MRIVKRCGDLVLPGMSQLNIVAYRRLQVRVSLAESIPVEKTYEWVEALIAWATYPSTEIGSEIMVLACLV